MSKNIFERINYDNLYNNSTDDIRELQKALGFTEDSKDIKTRADGDMGTYTIKALQRHINTKDDGYWQSNSKKTYKEFLEKEKNNKFSFFDIFDKHPDLTPTQKIDYESLSEQDLNQFGWGSDEAKAFQKWLADSKQGGFYTGDIDGKIGKNTKRAYTEYKKSKQPKVQSGVYYVTHPQLKINLSGQSPIKGLDNLQVKGGHGGIVVIDEDGNVTQYDYGRYDSNSNKLKKSSTLSNNLIGENQQDKLEGNWKKSDTRKIENWDYETLFNVLKQNNPNYKENIRLTYIDDANLEDVVQNIYDDANSENRITYGNALLSKAKWAQLLESDKSLRDRLCDLFTNKGCATSAYDVIESEIPNQKKAKRIVKNGLMHSNLRKRIFTPEENIKGRGNFDIYSMSPQYIEDKLSDMGYKIFDSINFKN